MTASGGARRQRSYRHLQPSAASLPRIQPGAAKVQPRLCQGNQESMLQRCLPILQNLEVIGSKNVMFTKGWLLAIACLTQLWDHLQSDHNLSYLFPSRLNQDIVENLFATVRWKGGCRDNPNAKEFRCALRMVMVADLSLSLVQIVLQIQTNSSPH